MGAGRDGGREEIMLRYAIVFTVALTVITATAQEQTCEGSTGRGAVACSASITKKKRASLEKELSALKTLMKSEGSFVHNAQYLEMLDKSQEAWEIYTQSYCRLQGTAKSGPNTWASHYAQKCELDAINKRISELKTLEKILRMEDQ